MADDPLCDPFESGDRDGNGRFRPGHKSPGPGNPNLATMNRHRSAMLAGVKDGDITKAMTFLIEVIANTDEKTSDRLTAAKMLLDRILGVPTNTEILARVEALELAAAEKGIR